MAEQLVFALGEFAATTRSTGLNELLVHDAKERVFDVIGNSIAAVGGEPGDIAFAVAEEAGGADQATVIGRPHRLPAASAALVNGTLAHALDFDDTHLPSVLHPSSPVVSAALAAAEAVDASGRSLLTAVAVGNEICVRIGMASYDPEIRNSILFENGLHATSIAGTLGAAAAVATLIDLSSEQISHAIGIAASMGAGLLEANRTGGSVKRIHCGWAAHAGINAALMASHGLTGPPTVLEGRFGFFRAYSEGRFDEVALLGGLGDSWEMPRIFYKPYPTNHFTHAGIDAALALRDRGVRPAEIVAIELGVPAPVLRTIAEPPDNKARPDTPYHAKFSGPFTVATALIGGSGLGVHNADFTELTLKDPVRLKLASMVKVVADDEATEIFPHQFPGVLTVRLRDGSTLTERIHHNRGGPERPLSEDELALKFRLNASERLSNDRVEMLQQAIWGLDEAPTVANVMKATY